MARLNQAMSDLLRYNSAMLPRKRSSFNKSHSHTTTLDSSYIVPLMWDRVLPGDEKKIKFSGLARMSTPIVPVMDNANFDVWCFYVPDRLWWSHAREFYGENKDASFNPDGEYVMPYLKPSWYCVDQTKTNFENGLGSLCDYFGMPVKSKEAATPFDDRVDSYIDAGLFRSYQLIYNEWFRNSSLQPALRLNTGDNVDVSEWYTIRTIRKANRYPDYFTTLLKEPQAGADVTLPLGAYAPVLGGVLDPEHPALVEGEPIIFYNRDGSYANNYSQLILSHSPGSSAGSTAVLNDSSITRNDGNVVPINLYADLSSATAATISQLRSAITVQHLLEVDNIAGKRYQQILQAHFGVFTPDATLQRPELLGASRTQVGMRQVLQTSSSTDTSTLGKTGAFSVTNVTNEWICNKAFTEPGYLLVLGCVRPEVTYSQGIDPLLQKLNRYDHYWPVFDNISNQPVYKRNLYFGENSTVGALNSVLGYQEAWTEYRIKQNRISGKLRPDIEGSLRAWTYTLDYASDPVMGATYGESSPNDMIHSLANWEEPQFICDCYFDYIDIKNMGVHSIPGLNRL